MKTEDLIKIRDSMESILIFIEENGLLHKFKVSGRKSKLCDLEDSVRRINEEIQHKGDKYEIKDVVQ
jgi:hypothetical protein